MKTARSVRRGDDGKGASRRLVSVLPYFFTLGKDAQEGDLEEASVGRIQDFLLELGVGFAFVGSQYRLDVGEEDFYIDLLFYHLKLRCYVVIDLKMGEFKPEFSGKMNFYISAVDSLLKHVDDQPTIGIIRCRSKNRAIAEYALRGLQKLISVATHQVGLPSAFASKLPTIEQLGAEMNTVVSQTIHNSELPLEE